MLKSGVLIVRGTTGTHDAHKYLMVRFVCLIRMARMVRMVCLIRMVRMVAIVKCQCSGGLECLAPYKGWFR